MNLDFFAVLEDAKTLKLYDISPLKPSLPAEIYAMSIDILSSKIPGGALENRLDVLAYLRTKREQRELYTITSDILGVGENENILDGVYHIKYNINNSLTKRHTFLIYKNVDTEVKKLLDEVGYNVEINDYDYEYVGDYAKYDIEKVRLCKSLLDSLEMQSQTPNEVLVNDTLDKLQRLLEIIKTDINY